MRDIADFLTENGAVMHVSALRSAGYTQARVSAAADAGRIVHVRRGIYASRWASAELVRAARVGGRLAETSAARVHGLWTPPSNHLVVEVSNSATRLRDPDDADLSLGERSDVRVLWSSESRSLAEGLGVSPLLDTLRQCVVSERAIHAIAILDSAVHLGMIDEFGIASLQSTLPSKYAAILREVDGRAESGTESIVRMLLRMSGVPSRSQVPIPLSDFERVDLLIGDRLVIECDSEAHHGGREQRLRDLRRDAELASLGFIVLRFDYSQVMFEPEAVLSAILTYVDLGLHVDAMEPATD